MPSDCLMKVVTCGKWDDEPAVGVFMVDGGGDSEAGVAAAEGVRD